MPYAELFGWWISSITFVTVFVIAVSIYLYMSKNTPEKETFRGVGKLVHILKDFAFVWVLLGLLILYVYSVGAGSYVVFVAGNAIVEVLLLLYVTKPGKHSQVPGT